MISHRLRVPLIQSAAFLIVVSLLVYLTATSVEGSFWGSLGTLFIAVFRIIQLCLGLILALFFCLAVLTGIFLACVAMVSRESASNMVEDLRQGVSDKLLFIREIVIRDFPPRGKRNMEVYGAELKKEIFKTFETSIRALKDQQAEIAENEGSLANRLDIIEKSDELSAFTLRLESQENQLEELRAIIDTIQQQLSQLQLSVDKMVQPSADEKQGEAILTLSQKINALEESHAALQAELKSINVGAQSGKEKSTSAQQPEEELGKHRLFAHIKNKDMQTKVSQLVTETLDTNMSYAQVAEHLVKNTKGKTAESLAAHPSLVKDYIRFRRKNG